MTEAQKRQEVEAAIAQIRSKGEQEIASMTLSAEVKAAIAKEVDADEDIAAGQKAAEKARREEEELENKRERKREEMQTQIAAKEGNTLIYGTDAHWPEHVYSPEVIRKADRLLESYGIPRDRLLMTLPLSSPVC